MPTPLNMNTKILQESKDEEVTAEQIEELAEATNLEEEEVENELIENSDGSVTINVENTVSPLDDPDFYANLAETFPESELSELAMDYLDFIEVDKESRKKRDEQYQEGLRRTGLGNDAPGGATFDGASKVVHPVIAEACVDFSASTCRELLPPDGVVKPAMSGELKTDIILSAERKTQFMNWQLDHQVSEYRDEMEQLITQLPLGGSQFLKWMFDRERRRPMCEWVPIDKIYLPFESTNFYEASRVTEEQDVTFDTFRMRIEDGTYRDVDVVTADINELEQTRSETSNDKIEGKSLPDENVDGLRRVYEITTFLRLDSDKETNGKRAPYILTIDEQSGKVLALRRNWESGDSKMQKLDWMVEFKFIPWRGAYAIGLPHLIGGLSAALTGALRALLDSAHINNSQTMLKLKGGRINGQTDRIEPTQIVEIESAIGIDDIRKVAMPMPFNAPSNVLYNMLDWLTNAAKGVVTTAEEKIGDTNANTPVGTTQALIEQGSKVANSIHARLHRSQAKSLQILSRINCWYLSEMDNQAGTDISADDFKYSNDVQPVSDPNIFSETQRFAQDQAVLQMATQFPQLYDLRKVNERVLKRMKIQNVDEILPNPLGVQESNPALENVAMSLGRPAAAFPDQDHLAHLKVHLAYAMDPMYGGGPLIGPTLTNALLEHIKQHITLHYLMSMKEYVVEAGGGEDPYKLNEERAIDREGQQALAYAAQLVNADSQTELAPFQQPIELLIQKAQQMAQAQRENIQDPAAQAVLQAQLAETKRKTEEMQVKFQLDGQKQQLDYQGKIQDLQAKLAELQGKFKAENDKLANQIAIANINNSATERLEMLKAGIQLNQQQMMAQQEQEQNAIMAQNQADQTLMQHQIDMEKGEIESRRAAEDADRQMMMQQQQAQQAQQQALMQGQQQAQQAQVLHAQAMEMEGMKQRGAQATQAAQQSHELEKQLSDQEYQFRAGGITSEKEMEKSQIEHDRAKETNKSNQDHALQLAKIKSTPKPTPKKGK